MPSHRHRGAPDQVAGRGPRTGIDRRRVLAASGGGLLLGGALVGISILAACEEREPRALITAPRASALSTPTPAAGRVVAVASGITPIVSTSTETPAPPPTPVVATASAPSAPSRALAVHEKGNPYAPVAVMDFSSYTCPHCRDFTLTTEPTVDKLYVATGRILFSFRHSPLDSAADRASEAVESAGALGDFWGYHHELMRRQPLLVNALYADSALIDIAADLALDTNAFALELDSGKYRDKIDADISEAITRRVRAVPTFFINGHRIQGNQGKLILDTIESQLTEAGDAR